MSAIKDNEIYSVSITDDEGDFRLGPYFTLQAARNQASRAKNKGATINSLDKATVEWSPVENSIAPPFRIYNRKVFCWRHLSWLCTRHGFKI